MNRILAFWPKILGLDRSLYRGLGGFAGLGVGVARRLKVSISGVVGVPIKVIVIDGGLKKNGQEGGGRVRRVVGSYHPKKGLRQKKSG